MEEQILNGLRARVNGALDAKQFLLFLNYLPIMARRHGNVWLAMCPIHKETVFRTLVVNPRNNTYHCEFKQCPGSNPADLVDLLAKSMDMSTAEALSALVAHFGAEVFKLSKRQVELLESAVAAREGG